jgi:hypothetical protein
MSVPLELISRLPLNPLWEFVYSDDGTGAAMTQSPTTFATSSTLHEPGKESLRNERGNGF